MDNITRSSNKNLAEDILRYNNKNDANDKFPIKKCHVLDGKYFVVIDKSLIDKLSISGDNIYFYQEVTEDGVLVLRPTTIND